MPPSKKRACPSTRNLQSLLAATMISSQRRKFGLAAVVVVFVALVHFMIPRSAKNHWPWHKRDFSRHRINKNVFDFDMLTRTEERYAAMLQKLQATITGLRDFQIYRLQTLAGKKNLATLSKSKDFLRSMELDIKNIKDLVGLNQSTASNMLKLQSYVQERIHTLQNPSDCGRSPKLRCVLDNPSGAGAGIHDLLWCFVAALRMGRTVILDSSRWHYAPGKQWGKTFLPVAGPSCSHARMNNTIEKGYPGNRSSGPDERSQILDLPSTIVEPLVGNHGNPYAWWYGQIVSYAFRLQNSTLQKIRKLKAALGYIHPIVGVHIRRTDKNGEAAYHSVEEYMTHVEEYYARLLLTTPIKRKRVFVATDERQVVAEIRKRFPDYVVVHNTASSSQWQKVGARRQSPSLFGVVSDIHLLAESNFLVCTMSSGFCRVAYELMQARHPDASTMAVSLDVEYFYAYVPFPPRRTLRANWPMFENELGWSGPGLLVERPGPLASYHEAMLKKYADGFVTGRIANRAANNETSVFPVFKTLQTYRVAHYNAFASLPSL